MSELLSPANLQPLVREERSPIELVRSGERARRVEVIPVDQIQIDFSLVDEGHSQDLADSMNKDWGQISEITVRARETEDDQIGYDIIDGFHRTDAKKKKGDTDINAIVLYGVTDEELYDLRILAVNSVKSVQFARLAEWMNRAFQKSRWADKGITLTQAFSMAVFDSQRTRHAGLEDGEVEELKEWVRQKATSWQRPVSAVWSNLRLIDISDPDLVKSVRTGGGGKDRIRHLSQGMLKAIAERFQGEELFHAQRAFADYAIQNRLGAGETGDFVYRYSHLINVDQDEEGIRKQLEELVEKEKTEKLQGSDIHTTQGENLIESDESWQGDDPEELIVLIAGEEQEVELEDVTQRVGHSDGEGLIDDDRRSGVGKLLNMRRGVPRNRTDEEFQPYIEKIAYLEELLRKANLNGSGEFWKTAPYLTSGEKTLMKALFEDVMRFDDVVLKFRINPRNLVQIIQSVFIKKKNYSAGETYHLEETSISALRKNGASSEDIESDECESREESFYPN